MHVDDEILAAMGQGFNCCHYLAWLEVTNDVAGLDGYIGGDGLAALCA